MATTQLETYPVKFTEGDLAPSIVVQILDATDTPIDISAYTFTMKMQRSGTTLLTKVAVSLNATTHEFQWALGDLVAGTHRVEVEQDDGTASVPETSDKFLIEVTEDLG